MRNLKTSRWTNKARQQTRKAVSVKTGDRTEQKPITVQLLFHASSMEGEWGGGERREVWGGGGRREGRRERERGRDKREREREREKERVRGK